MFTAVSSPAGFQTGVRGDHAVAAISRSAVLERSASFSALAMISSATINPLASRPPSSRGSPGTCRSRRGRSSRSASPAPAGTCPAPASRGRATGRACDRRPRALELLGAREEVVELLMQSCDELLLGSREGALVEDGLDQRALALLVVLARRDEREVRRSTRTRRRPSRASYRCRRRGRPTDRPRRPSCFAIVLHLGHPAVEAHLHRRDRHAVELVDVVEQASSRGSSRAAPS